MMSPQVHIPPPKLNRNKDGEGLVPITDLEPWAQMAFKGTKRLNPMQSKASVACEGATGL